MNNNIRHIALFPYLFNKNSTKMQNQSTTALVGIKRANSCQALLIKWPCFYKSRSFVLTQCQQGKTSATTLKNPVLLLISLGKSHKAIFKQFDVHHYTVRTIIHKWKTFKTSDNLPRTGDPSKITLRLHYTMLRETGKT